MRFTIKTLLILQCAIALMMMPLRLTHGLDLVSGMTACGMPWLVCMKLSQPESRWKVHLFSGVSASAAAVHLALRESVWMVPSYLIATALFYIGHLILVWLMTPDKTATAKQSST